jgi:hypothetical protein
MHKFEVRPFWAFTDPYGDHIIASGVSDDDHDDCCGCDWIGHTPDGWGVYENTEEGPQMHVVDCPSRAVAERIADALETAHR